MEAQSVKDTFYRLNQLVNGMALISTHEHHMPDEDQHRLNLDGVFRSSYVGWCGFTFDESAESRNRFLAKVAGNSYFVWLEKALRLIYGFNERISAASWDTLSQRIADAHTVNENHHLDIMKHYAGYRAAIQDSYWDPGDNLGHGDFLASAFRVNMFLYGYHPDAKDHNGNNPQRCYGVEPANLADYLDFIHSQIASRRGEIVALKAALAYDRNLDFDVPSFTDAAAAYGQPPGKVSPAAEKAFGDYVFNHICRIASEMDLPVQIHTGLGRISGSNPMNLIPLIEAHPQTRFILLHAGYPWIHEVGGLAHNYGNVYPDLTWLPLISTSAAVVALHEYIEVARSTTTICWGGDAWTGEESVGAALALRHVLARVLSEKIDDDYLDEDTALRIARGIMYDNPREIYGLS